MQLKRTLRGSVLLASAFVVLGASASYADSTPSTGAVVPDASAVLGQLPATTVPLPNGGLPTLPGVDDLTAMPGAVTSCLPAAPNTPSLPKLPAVPNLSSSPSDLVDSGMKRVRSGIRTVNHTVRTLPGVDDLRAVPEAMTSCLAEVVGTPSLPAVPAVPDLDDVHSQLPVPVELPDPSSLPRLPGTADLTDLTSLPSLADTGAATDVVDRVAGGELPNPTALVPATPDLPLDVPSVTDLPGELTGLLPQTGLPQLGQ